MNKGFYIGVALVLGLMTVCGYWYVNPYSAPSFIRGFLPSGFELNSQSPMSNFRAPSFGPR